MHFHYPGRAHHCLALLWLILAATVANAQLPIREDSTWAWGWGRDDGNCCWNVSHVGFQMVGCPYCLCDRSHGACHPPEEPEYPCLLQEYPPIETRSWDGCGPHNSENSVWNQGCSMHWRYCIDHDCDSLLRTIGRGPRYGGIEPAKISFEPCKGGIDSSYKPAYGDDVCYTVQVSHTMTVIATVLSSTYEGIAMNAPQPPGDTNTTSDVIPIFEDGWTFHGHDYQGGFSRWHASRLINAGEEVEFHVRVLDYAAEARIYVGSADSLAWSRMNFIPLYALPWLSNADADSDGFTVWEEYRGFCNADSSHFRLDTSLSSVRREVLLIDDGGFFVQFSLDEAFRIRLQEMSACSLVLQPTLVTFGVSDSNHFTWDRLDRFQSSWDADEADWQGLPGLTFPGYNHASPIPSWGLCEYERGFDQVAIRLTNVQVSDTSEVGHVNHVFGGPDWGFGICGNAGVAMDFNRIETTVRSWPHLYDYHMREYFQVLAICQERTVAHEFGHVLNVTDHCGPSPCNQCTGSDSKCVLYNEMMCPVDPNPGIDYWPDWVQQFKDGVGSGAWDYKSDDRGCRSQLRYRP
jgi:hypothetical protein